ncbi:hypothetical protein [Alicyclobacillus suci]|uniref:hypothetical protein n=1 Tax=Alicyclobacillus suci TaxID=2816080 RepID=UPI001A8E2A01|nr:hypothetical protein [Alicyclobacillus suci]
MIELGTAECALLTDPGLVMWGYAARLSLGERTHDTLYVKAACFQTRGQHAFFLVTMDLLDVPLDFPQSIEQRLCSTLRRANITVQMVSSHTHAAPSLVATEPQNQTFVAIVIEKIAETCVAAYRRLQPVVRTARWSGEMDQFGAIRRQGKVTPLPLHVQAFYADAEHANPILVLFHLPCHPTVLSAANLRYSAEWPGVARSVIEAHFGDGTQSLFLNGAAGDISTRQTRRAQDFEEMERFGLRAGQVVLATMVKAPDFTVDNPNLVVASSLVTLRPAARIHLAALRDVLNRPCVDQRTAETLTQAMNGYDVVHAADVSDVRIPLRVWYFPGVGLFAFWPGEPFSTFQQLLDAEVSLPIALVGYGGCVGYLPDVTPYQDPSYEVLMSVYGQEGARELLVVTKRLVHELFANQPQGGV